MRNVGRLFNQEKKKEMKYNILRSVATLIQKQESLKCLCMHWQVSTVLWKKILKCSECGQPRHTKKNCKERQRKHLVNAQDVNGACIGPKNASLKWILMGIKFLENLIQKTGFRASFRDPLK